MDYIRNGIGALFVLVVAVVVLNLEVGTETVVQPYYTYEPLRWEETFVREGTTTKWQWGWPPRVTVPQVQYGLKNVDSIGGQFLVSVSFDNGVDRRSENKRVVLAPGQEETVFVASPISGQQSFGLDVTPPSKRVQQLREVEVSYKVYEKLWQLRDMRFLSRAR
ncbi:MAG: hypothetical protein F4Y63_04910 [Chloroflexi bacterium]|nr:hypothetical protein [Chloroflexota bacterium]MYF79961.1 hypothetical protein [Chloroflexota bacterium]MYK60985.1 hypothetical protein [Chloroflexota bacterium]